MTKRVRVTGWLVVAVALAAWPISARAARDGARSLPPSGRGLGTRVTAPQPRTAEDVLVARPPPVGVLSARPLDFVTRVIDGDTVRLRERGVVRLIGVDTPETKHPRKPIQRCGPEASAFTRAAVEKRWVSWEPDREARDKYGRWLAYVHREPDRFFLNAELVRQGAARAYIYFPFRLRKWFVELEQAAQRDRLGIWGLGSGCEVAEPVAALTAPEGTEPVTGPPVNALPPPAPTTVQPPPEPVKPNAPSEAQGRKDEPAPAEGKPKGVEPPSGSRGAKQQPGHRPGCDIKGNINGSERIYHLPGGSHYERTQIDERHGERWFCSEAEAQQAGWRKARN